MTNFIPIFPLGLVVYPGEPLHLHIFEPRYRQLINECLQTGKPFGIPVVIDKKISDLGTIVEVRELSKLYDDGKMDIKTRGISVFRILEVVKEIPEKLYSGAIASHLNNFNNGSSSLMKHIIDAARKLHEYIGESKKFEKPDEELCSFDIAHHVGLTIEEEFVLLGYENELHRQEFLKRHLDRILPVMKEMESLKKKIKLNGHFKNLEGFNF